MKSLIKFFIIFFMAISFSHCSFTQFAVLAKKGSVSKEEFQTKIPFVYYNDLIFIKVVIDGNSYNFFVDTGAGLNVIGKNIIDQINYKHVSKSKVSGSSNISKKAQLIELEKISIANLDFAHTGAIIMDLSHLQELLACQKIDGIIGNNLLRKATWQINYNKQEIIISNKIENMFISPNAHKIDIDSKKWGNVYLDINIDGEKSKYTFDTGFTGKIKSNKALFNDLLKGNNNLEYIVETGRTGANIYEITNGYIYNVYVDSVDIEGIKIQNQIINLSESSKSLLGNGFFKNYILTMDWNNNRLYLDPMKEIEADTLKGYQLVYQPNYTSNKLEVIRYWDNYKLDDSISLGAQILEINGLDISNYSTDELCNYWGTERNKKNKEKVLNIVILDQGIEKYIQLNEAVLLPK